MDHLPGFALPIEPARLTRAERFTAGLIILVVVSQITLGLVILLTSAQAEDPALLQRDGVEQREERDPEEA